MIDSGVADTGDDPVDIDDGFWTHFLSCAQNMVTHQFPTMNFVNQSILLYDSQSGKRYQVAANEAYSQYIYPVGTGKFEALNAQDIGGNFDPSRIPPRVAYRLAHARTAVGKDIIDLLKSEKGRFQIWRKFGRAIPNIATCRA